MTSPLEAPRAVFYRVNTLKVPLSRLRRFSTRRAWLAKAAVLKLLRIRMRGVYMTDPTAIELVSAVPPGSPASIILEESIRACRDAGLVEQFAYRVPQLTAAENVAVLFAAPDRRMLTVVSVTLAIGRGGTAAALSLLCWSRLDDEGRVTTSTFPGLAPSTSWEDREVVRGRSVAAIVGRHRERIDGRDVLPFSAEKTGIMHDFLRMNRTITDDLIARGILEPMAAGEIASVRQQRQMVQ